VVSTEAGWSEARASMVGRVKRSNISDVEFVMVKEPEKSKSVQQVLADGRSTGHFKLQGRRLQAVRTFKYLESGSPLLSVPNFPSGELEVYRKKTRHQDGEQNRPMKVPVGMQMPEVWDESSFKNNSNAWWDAVGPISLDLLNNQIKHIPEGLAELAETLQNLDLRYRCAFRISYSAALPNGMHTVALLS